MEKKKPVDYLQVISEYDEGKNGKQEKQEESIPDEAYYKGIVDYQAAVQAFENLK